ncbi:MAG TPA: 4-hydroxythreonine-4-phosphate dehydrogenase PdxA [Verrucomicrobiae bacterium]|jgi:4-hydroxythreonine-4-phosphate dehydrogenase|nr:4-hydroxythreonine-4-phosphate dehydrogenase PdxA [Verrucomicrobiae bacterium]
MKGWIGITLGDPSGIGPEVALKGLALAPADGFRYLLLGNEPIVQRLNRELGLSLPIESFRSYAEAGSGRFFIWNTGPELPKDVPCGSPIAAESAMAALGEGAQRSIRGELDGIVTAPVNKESIIKLGRPFMGQTEYLSDLAGAPRTAMMLLGQDDRGRWLRVALVTTHIPLRSVAEKLSGAKIEQTIELAAEACAKLRLPRARVAVCGLNPHAGEGGQMGTEEITTITPAVQNARKKGLDVEGPIPADTLFYYAYSGHYDAVVAMYHDQGLGPLKMIGFESGINWTLGLPFIRTSPDHGTAYNIAGQNKANPSSMAAALNLARNLASG